LSDLKLSAPTPDATADIKLRAMHPEMARLAALFGAGEGSAAASYGALDLYGELTGTRQSLALNKIQGSVAGIGTKGNATAELGGAKPKLVVKLQTGAVELDRFMAAPAPNTRKGGTGKAPTASAGSKDEPLDFGWLHAFDGQLELTSAALAASGTRIENAAILAAVNDGTLTLERFDGGLMGGQLGVTGRLAAPTGGPPTAEAAVTLVKAQLAEALSSGPLPFSGGVFDLDMTLNTAGASRDAMLRTLSGNGRVAGRDGVIRGFDLAALGERLSRLNRPQDALEAALRGFQGGETRFAELGGTFVIERGVARTEDLRLVTAAGDASAVGDVNLPDGTIDMRVRVAAKAASDVPPMTMRLSGSLDAPTRSFDMQEVQSFLARRAIGDKAPEAFRNLLDRLGR
jgi:uncharacterized protein involved in outer membrane biogenesis